MTTYEFMAMLGDGKGTFTVKRSTDVFSKNRDSINEKIRELKGFIIYDNVVKFYNEEAYMAFANFLSGIE